MRALQHCLIAALLAVTPAAAQDGGEDTAFDNALKDYGYAGGAAWQCAANDAKGGIVDDAMHVYNRLAQLFGTDRAFFFSAAFGAGTVDEIPPGDCERHSADFAEGLKGTGAEGAK